MRRATVAAGVACAVGAVLTVFASAVTPNSASAAGSDLPPSSRSALRQRFDPLVKPFGLQVTRAMLESLETYERDPEGTHLALYVEPIKPGYTDAQYLKSFPRLVHAFIPKVFEQWRSLESFDICQEPETDSLKVPPPVSQIFVKRDALDRIGDWRRADLTQLLQASPRTRSVAAGYYVYFAPELRDDPAFVAAAARAGWTTGDTSPGY